MFEYDWKRFEQMLRQLQGGGDDCVIAVAGVKQRVGENLQHAERVSACYQAINTQLALRAKKYSHKLGIEQPNRKHKTE